MKQLQQIECPHGVFHGENFMTPQVMAYYKLRKGYAELSQGRGLYNDTIFGVTVRNIHGQDPDHKSKCCMSLQEAMEYLQELS